VAVLVDLRGRAVQGPGERRSLAAAVAGEFHVLSEQHLKSREIAFGGGGEQ
jgi:hypothetical protein